MKYHFSGFMTVATAVLLSSLLLTTNVAAATLIGAHRQEVQQPQVGPDLVVETITVSPVSVGAGGSAEITPVIKNNGEGFTSLANMTIHLYLDPVDNPPTPATPHTTSTSIPVQLAAGATYNSWTVTRDFTRNDWRLCVWVDRGNSIQEANDDNNILCIDSPNTPPIGEKDTYEDDDSCDTVKTISTDGVIQNRNLFRHDSTDDVDWIKFAGEGDVKYVIEAVAIGKDADLFVELHSTCNGPPSFGNNTKITFTAPVSGDYYLKVGNNQPNYGAQNDYTIKVTADASCSLSFEPNDLCALPAEISVGAGEQEHSFCTEGDVDWMRFPVRAGAKYNIEAKNIGTAADVQLSLYTNCQDAGASRSQKFEYTAPMAGYLHIKAENLDPKVFGNGTAYSLAVTGTGGCEEDLFEQDDVRANAQPLNIDGNTQIHNICPAADEDWMRFDATADITYTVETLNLGSKADTILCLYDASGAEIRCDDDGGAGKASRLLYQSATNTTIYVKARDRDPEVAGPDTKYEVQVLTGRCKNDAAEPDNSQATAKTIADNGASQARNICATDDQDWLAFTATANTAYVISTTALGPDADTEIELYDAAGNLLARNDDHTPGVNALLNYTIGQGGTYYIKAQHYNRERYGTGTEYAIAVRPGTATPPVTPPPITPPSIVPPVTPPATGVRTLILVNRSRIAQLYSEDEATQLLSKLETLAQQPTVQGEIIRLDNNTDVSTAYTNWVNDITNVDKANLVTNAIRRLVMTYLQERSGVEFVVIVGEDRVLPMRRVADNTARQSENTYTEVDANHPTGAAIRANYFLTDDYYVDKEPTPHKDREIYVPDLAIGRLIETPADMIKTIDNFIANPTTPVEQVLVTGYDFVQDAGQADCNDWKKLLGDDSKVTCLIGSNWSKQQFSDLQFRNNPAFKIQSINGHADHYTQGSAVGSGNVASEVNAATIDLQGGLIYTLACHGGLNVPPSNSVSPLDLPEAFVRKGASYVGNTGYGWGLLSSIGLSEKVMRLFTKELGKDAEVPMGRALAAAKRFYFAQDQNFSVFDEKVMQQFVFYGLPMQKVTSSGSLTLGDEFPGVGLDFNDSPGSLGPEDLITKTININFARILDPNDQIGNLDSFNTDSGSYLSLYDSITADADEPVQPLYFGNVSIANTSARAAVLVGGDYSTTQNFDPLVGTPVNEYVPRDKEAEAQLDSSQGWYPPVPAGIRALDGRSNIVTQLGQYNADSDELRLYSNFEVEVYYSTSTDQTAPEITVVDALYDSNARVNVKVGVIDTSGIKEVIVSYIQDSRQAAASIKSIKLSFDASTQKWRGSFPGNEDSVFFVQAVDNAGNVVTASNKGNYYRPAQSRTTASSNTLYLPIVAR